MTVLIFIVILLFPILSGWYLIKNSFARETLEVVFPAFGAILLSLYLGFKSVVIEKPDSRKFDTTVAVLHDSRRGTVSGMPPDALRHLSMMGDFWGASMIGELPLYNSYKDIPIAQQLKKTERIENVLATPADSMIADIVQATLLEWLAHHEQAIGFMPASPVLLINGIAKGGEYQAKLNLVAVETKESKNLLINKIQRRIELPAGSRIWVTSEPLRSITIKTKHSRVTARIQPRSWALLQQPVGRDTERIYSSLHLPSEPKGLSIHGFTVEITAEQFAFSRFHPQAKIEAEWFKVLERKLESNFSWSRLRALHAAE